jgi:hypothetical protein
VLPWLVILIGWVTRNHSSSHWRWADLDTGMLYYYVLLVDGFVSTDHYFVTTPTASRQPSTSQVPRRYVSDSVFRYLNRIPVPVQTTPSVLVHPRVLSLAPSSCSCALPPPPPPPADSNAALILHPRSPCFPTFPIWALLGRA